MAGILDEAFAAVAQAPESLEGTDGALAPASPAEQDTPDGDPLSELAQRLGGLSASDKRRLISEHAQDVLDAEANARASKTLSRRQQESEAAQARADYAEQMLAVLRDDYDAMEKTARQAAEQFQRQTLLESPELRQESLTQWRAQQAAKTREHDFYKDIPEDVWQRAAANADVADYYAELARWKIDHGYVPKREVRQEVTSAEQRERARLFGTASDPDRSRSEAAASRDDQEAQLRAVVAAVRAHGGNPTREQSALLESLSSSLQTRVETSR